MYICNFIHKEEAYSLMKTFKKLINYIFCYKIYFILVCFFAILSTITALFSFAFFIPVFQILFKTNIPPTVAPAPLSITHFSAQVIKDNIYYLIANFIIGLKPQTALLYVIFSIVILFCLKDIFRYLVNFNISPIRQGVMSKMRNELYHKILILPLSFYSQRKKGDIISRMTSDVQEVESSIMSSLEIIIIEPVTIILYIITLIIISPRLTIFALILMPVSGYVIGRIGGALKGYSKRGQSKLGNLISMIEESIDGLRIIKGFNAIDHSYNVFVNKNNDYTRTMIKLLRIRDIASPLSEFLGVCLVVAAVWYGGNLVLADKSSLSAAALIVYIAIFSQLLPPIKSLSQGYSNIKKGTAALDRINEILDADEVIVEKPNAKDISNFKDKIEFKDVCFKYEETEVLKNINLTIEKGKQIAIVGPSGSGKTTIANLMSRFYDCTGGAIQIDGIPIPDIKINQLRHLFGIVTQDTILFNDTVAANISFGLENCNIDDIMKAAQIANAHDFIMQLPEKYDTIIGDKGTKLSGGQRQRISIARALLRNPQILILDEATSSLDTESEKAVQDALESLMKSRTSIVIAHRLSTIVNSDEIIVLKDGQIIERGTHNELYSLNGLYTKLCDMQTI